MAIDQADVDLVARHLRKEAGTSAEDGLEKWRALPEAARSVALARLREIDRFLSLERPTHDDADDAAARLGMGRRNFYRLISRLREHGPIVGLAPHARAKTRASAAREGLDEISESALKMLLLQRPDAAVSAAMEAIEAAFAEAKAEGRPPSAMTVRGRLAELRRPGGWLDQNRWQTGCTFARRILVDQCSVSSRSLKLGSDFALSFIVDVETRLILGCGPTDFEDLWMGLSSAVRFARRQADRLIVGEFPVADKPDHVRWVVPDELRQWVEMVKSDFAASGSRLSSVATGKQRHGQRLLELLGPEFDVFRLTPRATGGASEPLGLFEYQPEEVSRAIERAVERWNYRVLEGASRLPPADGSAVMRARLAEWRSHQRQEDVVKLVNEVAAPFERLTDLYLKVHVGSLTDRPAKLPSPR